VAKHANHEESSEEVGGRREASEREAADDAKREDARADELLERGERLEREAAEIEVSEPERAADLRHGAGLVRDSARDVAEASTVAQEMVEDERPFESGSDRDEGGEA
jgi:hypothetical protein